MRLCAVSCFLVGSAATMLLTGQDTRRGNSDKVYSVCEVLQKLDSLNGKVIAVRGIVSGGQGTFLIDRCQSKLTVKGFTWPDAIWLEFPRDDTPFEADLDAYFRIREAIKHLRQHKDDQVMITVVGLLEAKDLDKVTGLNSLGKPIGFGFGAGNLAPAQLVVKTEMNPSVVRKSK